MMTGVMPRRPAGVPRHWTLLALGAAALSYASASSAAGPSQTTGIVRTCVVAAGAHVGDVRFLLGLAAVCDSTEVEFDLAPPGSPIEPSEPGSHSRRFGSFHRHVRVSSQALASSC